jgi:hypothetical protein
MLACGEEIRKGGLIDDSDKEGVHIERNNKEHALVLIGNDILKPVGPSCPGGRLTLRRFTAGLLALRSGPQLSDRKYSPLSERQLRLLLPSFSSASFSQTNFLSAPNNMSSIVETIMPSSNPPIGLLNLPVEIPTAHLSILSCAQRSHQIQ